MSEVLRVGPPTPKEINSRLRLIDDFGIPGVCSLRLYLAGILLEMPDEVVEFVFNRMVWSAKYVDLPAESYIMTSVVLNSEEMWMVFVSGELTAKQAEKLLPGLILSAYAREDNPGLSTDNALDEAESLLRGWGLDLPNSFPMLVMEAE